MSKHILNHATLQRLTQTPSFLNKIKILIKWIPIHTILICRLGNRSNAANIRAYPPLKMFKIILIQTLFNLSDREMEESLFDRVSFRKFTGFLFELQTPSYSTICRFRNKLIKLKLDEDLFKLINQYLTKSKLINKKTIIVDSSIIRSSRRSKKVFVCNSGKIAYSNDVEAKWTVKANRPYYGYKLHMGTDSNGFIIGGHITSANYSDTKELFNVINNIPFDKGAFVLADKGYASAANRKQLTIYGLNDGIMHNAKKLTLLQKKTNSKISSVRCSVERVFGTLKEQYGFHKTKYLGIMKTKGQFLLSAIAYNLKKASTFMK